MVGGTTLGFQCNIYSDGACQNFVGTVKPSPALTRDICNGIPGSGITCFNQAAFDNPFADSTAEVTVGSKQITVDIDGKSLAFLSIDQACNDNGCDPTNKFTHPFEHSNKDCTESVTVEGNYDNADQREYMKSLLGETLLKTESNRRLDLCCSSEDNNIIKDVASFAQVVVNDALGNNQAQMSVTVGVDCIDTTALDCASTRNTLTEAALSTVPAVGGLAAGIFKVLCGKV
ncbi:hypothetical protein LTR37_011927 [Vermiconidia calcicola]|uniref:Uncharacterized protein n=1 Tax=Vermiconidia calcicola TaxID=1690605 RepID=A0ACC3N0Q7_9PEZI|nr:hypothetical protein LTR37_011927 [Vermiconidia calcicola]